ncbi:hypothetical protein, partial [Streptococcus danieliae]
MGTLSGSKNHNSPSNTGCPFNCFRIIPVVSDPRYTKGIEEYKKKNRHGKVAIFPFCEPQYNVKAL